MILTIDIGNSHIMLGGFLKNELCFVSRISTDLARTEDEYACRFLEALTLHGINKHAITGAIVASVVPPLNATVRQAIRFVFGVDPLFVGPGIKSGIS
ncbi:MAG: type III pantothenate kinase, partial [Clostridia bacterium]|nr:type III pantothenate kinase [Clostridia bacterium]